MNFSQLVSLFESLIDAEGEVDNSKLAIWFNEAQLDLALDAGEIRQVSLERLSPPPADLLSILELTDEEGNSIDWDTDTAGRLVFDRQKAQLLYRAMPTVSFSGTDNTQESLLPAPLHYLMAYYAAWKYWDAESGGDTEESSHASKFMNYYYQNRSRYLARLNIAGGYGRVKQWQII